MTAVITAIGRISECFQLRIIPPVIKDKGDGKKKGATIQS
jgi:hypothetical protein